ncbi:GNAT family N-acetyltransferase [Fulvimarina sp. 2208YS6-2-32]|uniref:GNAT family N-acetyltransferase n=1 Tax=Fulvimarina uroteuthidis TaxID=3098149 RepID=A0ABU5HXV0_9HYPH|nr:GNAT family N-acetyltransferase [Fulvimarina sp. 2208YS6-2-32]MDY8107969.1 GNAT family N-acetyltransferase [Fulvimarina sp. 2208YS6-2-32]
MLSFEIEAGFRPVHRQRAAQGYWRAFSRKLRYPLGPEGKAVDFISRVIDPEHAISAVSHDGDFLGVAGFKSPEGAFIDGGLRDLVATYGWIGAAFRALLISTLERDCEPDSLLMDGIFVEPHARGKGVGKALLKAIETQAVLMGLRKVRLDVIDTNPRARALYEREGFVATSVLPLGPLGPVFGFARATRMTKPVGI